MGRWIPNLNPQLIFSKLDLFIKLTVIPIPHLWLFACPIVHCTVDCARCLCGQCSSSRQDKEPGGLGNQAQVSSSKLLIHPWRRNGGWVLSSGLVWCPYIATTCKSWFKKLETLSCTALHWVLENVETSQFAVQTRFQRKFSSKLSLRLPL